MRFYRIIVCCLLLLVAGAVYAQDDALLDFEEMVLMSYEQTTVAIPENWNYELDEDTGAFILSDEDEANLQLQIFDSLELDERVDVDLDTPVDEAMVAVYEDFYGIEIDIDDVEVEELDDDITVAAYFFSEDNISVLVLNDAIESMFFIDIYNTEGDEISDDQLEIILEIILSVDNANSDAVVTQSCDFSVEEDDVVRLRVGPGTNRTAIAFLPAGDYEAIGQELANDDSTWFKLDIEVVAPDSGANEIWVAADSVDADSNCDNLNFVGAPPIIPGVVVPASGNGDDNTSSPVNVSGGNYTVFYAEMASGNCVGEPSVPIPSSDIGLTPEPVNITTSGNDLVLDGDVLVGQGNGQYVGSYSFDDGSNGQIYLSATGSNSFTGQLVVNFTIEGTPCSATVGLSIR